MARCEICGKGTVFGNNVSHSLRRTSRTWKANVRKVKIELENGSTKKTKVCTSCLRSDKVKEHKL